MIEGDGSLLTLAVPSVEAPVPVASGRLATPPRRPVTRLRTRELVYAAFPLDDGEALAIVVMPPERAFLAPSHRVRAARGRASGGRARRSRDPTT